MVEAWRAAAEDPIAESQSLPGHLAEWRELVASVREHVELIVLAADPLSGTSRLLDAAPRESSERHILVDARLCANTRDLATPIADAAVGAMAPEALAWWQGLGPPASASGLRLGRLLHDKGIGTDELRAATDKSQCS